MSIAAGTDPATQEHLAGPRGRRSIARRVARTARAVTGVGQLVTWGGTLPGEEFDRRHGWLVRLLCVASAILLVSSLATGYGLLHSLLDSLSPLGLIVLARRFRASQRSVSVAVALGLCSAAAAGVHVWHGAIEAHFAFFVAIVLLSLYEDWVVFATAIGFVLVHHGVIGMLAPQSVFAPTGHWSHPWLWALIHALFVAAAGAGGLLTWRLNEDVRARLCDVQLQALESEEHHRQLIEQITDVIIRTSVRLAEDQAAPPALTVTYCSPSSLAVLGITDEQGVEDGRRILDCVHPADRGRLVEAIVAAARRAAPQPQDYRFTRPDGTEGWLRDKPRLVGRTGDDIDVQSMWTDITELKAAELEREQMELELRLAQKLESVGQLAAGVAHEINTPIQFIGDSVRFLEGAFEDVLGLVESYGTLRDAAAAQANGLAEIAARIAASEEEIDLPYILERAPAAFYRTTDGIQRVGTIVRAMREFAHPPTTGFLPQDLNAALENTLIVSHSEYRDVADVEFVGGDIPAVSCNVGDVNQLFLNLIVNAGQAIESKVAGSGERGLIRITTRREDDHVVVSIADSGCGIPDEIAGRIWDQFFTTKDVGRGTGQGLAISMAVVKRHRAAITFDSVPGEGTTFHVKLHIDPAAAAADAPADAPAPAKHAR
jgi:PAS domain S-box-containing protein